MKVVKEREFIELLFSNKDKDVNITFNTSRENRIILKNEMIKTLEKTAKRLKIKEDSK